MKNLKLLLAKKVSAAQVAVAMLVTSITVPASAALPTWASTAGADLSGSISDFEGMVGPIIVAVAVAVVGIKLFKRFTNKI